MRTLVFLLAVAGCTVGDNEYPEIAGSAACEQQAELYCSAIGFPTSGCETVYRRTICTDRSLQLQDQELCVSALHGMTRDALGDYSVPLECSSLWR